MGAADGDEDASPRWEEVRREDGTRIGVRIAGPDTRPTLVLVHGLGLSTRSWDRIVPALAARHRVVAYDLRGHGRSSLAADGDYSIEAHAEDLGAVLDHAVSAQGRVVLVANSFGGAVVLAYAHRNADARIAGVVFAGSSGSAVTFPGLPLRNVPPWFENAMLQVYLGALRGAADLSTCMRSFQPVTRGLVRRSAFHSDSPVFAVDEVREDFFATSPEALARTTLASGSDDWTRYASSLRAPALVLWGDRDPEIPRENIDALLDSLPNGDLVVLEGAAHMLAITHPESVVSDVERWARFVS